MRRLRKLSYILVKERKQVRFLLFSGIILGVLVGVVGSLFQLSILWFSSLRDHLLGLYRGCEAWEWSASIVFTTVLLVASIWIVRRFAPEAAGSGVQEIEGVLVNFVEISRIDVARGGAVVKYHPGDENPHQHA